MSQYTINPVSEAGTTRIDIENDASMRVTLLTYGASLYNLEVLDEKGNYVPLVLSNASIRDFKKNPQYFGKSVGRVAGRITLSHFKIGKNSYTLQANNGRHSLHGGHVGFSYQEFAYEIKEDEANISVAFGLFSPHLEGGYPGNLTVSIIYHISKKHQSITIEYFAQSDEDTLVNLTNHSYFNLSGDLRQNVLDHLLMVDASRYTKVDDQIIVQSIEPVNSVMNFKTLKRVGQDLFDPSIYQTGAKGYDHCFLLDPSSMDTAKLMLIDPVSKRRLRIFTTYPAIVIYSDNYPNIYPLQGGVTEVAHAGLAIETQYVPGDQKMMTLPKGQNYYHQTRYVFDKID